jgi:hypothetical protein
MPPARAGKPAPAAGTASAKLDGEPGGWGWQLGEPRLVAAAPVPARAARPRSARPRN